MGCPREAAGYRLLLSTQTKQKIEAKGNRKVLDEVLDVNEWCPRIIGLSIGYTEEI